MTSPLKKARNRRYPAEIISDDDYSDDQVFLANTPAQVECLLHSLKQAARGIGLYVKSDKTDFMCFKQDGAIATLNDKLLTSINHFKYLGSYILSTESDINIRIGKA